MIQHKCLEVLANKENMQKLLYMHEHGNISKKESDTNIWCNTYRLKYTQESKSTLVMGSDMLIMALL